MNQIKICALAVLLVFLLVQSASAINVYVRPPIMIAHMNLTAGQTVYNAFLEVKNLNEFPVNVTFKPQGNFTSDMISLSNTLLTLQPNETVKNNFTITTNQAGVYKGVILVTYITNNTPGVALQSDLTVMATGNVPTEVQSNFLNYVLIAVAALVICIAGIFVQKQFSKKASKQTKISKRNKK